MYNIKDAVVRGETIELGNDNYNNIGPNVVFEDCEFIVRAPARDLIVTGVTFVRGVWRQKRKLLNKQFSRASFDGVSFEGKFSGCRWGSRDEPETATLKSCDFSNAELDACEFVNVDPDEVTFGPWPTIAYHTPQQLHPLIQDLDAPSRLKTYLNVIAGRPPEFGLAADHAPSLEKATGVPQDQIHALLKELPGVVILA